MSKWLELNKEMAEERKQKSPKKGLPFNLNKEKTGLQNKDFISMVSNTAITDKKNKGESPNEKNKKRKLPIKPR